MDYQDYLQSDHWRTLSAETKRLAGNRCQVCNSPDRLETHHRTYERKGDELQSDLVCLCHECHEKFHGLQVGALVNIPAKHTEIIKMDALLFSLVMTHPNMTSKAINHLICPTCGDECSHFSKFEELKDARGWDSAYVLRFYCESDHGWELIIGYSNGMNFIYEEELCQPIQPSSTLK